MRSDVLVVEISGKRPGDNNARPTEKNKLDYDHIIVKDVEAINKKMLAMFQKYATHKKDELKISEIKLP